MKISLKAAANLTQQEVAEKLGVSKHTIINWENGKTRPKKCMLILLSQFYNIDIDYFNV